MFSRVACCFIEWLFVFSRGFLFSRVAFCFREWSARSPAAYSAPDHQSWSSKVRLQPCFAPDGALGPVSTGRGSPLHTTGSASASRRPIPTWGPSEPLVVPRLQGISGPLVTMYALRTRRMTSLRWHSAAWISTSIQNLRSVEIPGGAGNSGRLKIVDEPRNPGRHMLANEGSSYDAPLGHRRFWGDRWDPPQIEDFRPAPKPCIKNPGGCPWPPAGRVRELIFGPIPVPPPR